MIAPATKLIKNAWVPVTNKNTQTLRKYIIYFEVFDNWYILYDMGAGQGPFSISSKARWSNSDLRPILLRPA